MNLHCIFTERVIEHWNGLPRVRIFEWCVDLFRDMVTLECWVRGWAR